MKTKKTGLSPKARLETGAAIIAAAQVTNVTVIKPRMTLFVRTHGDYGSAQAAVEAADIGRRKARADVQRCADAQVTALEGVARALVIDGAPRDTPFAAFETGSPFTIYRLSHAEQAKAIRTLLDAIQASKTVGAAPQRAARTAQQAVAAVEAALLTRSQAAASARLARDKRAQLGSVWDQALAALKRAARAAGDDGAPDLYEALFGGLRRSKRKKAAAKAVEQKDTATAVTQPVTQPPAVGASPPVSAT